MKKQCRVRLQDDFYEAVNGAELAGIAIDPAEVSWSWSQQLLKNQREQQRLIFEELAANRGSYAGGSSEQKIADLYACYRDNAERNRIGLGPLQRHYDAIRNAENLAAYIQSCKELVLAHHISSIVPDIAVGRDGKDAARYSAIVGIPNTLSGKSFHESKELQAQQQMFHDHIVQVMELNGETAEAARRIQRNVGWMVRELAKEDYPPEDYLNPAKTYHALSAQEVSELWSNVPDIADYLEANGVGGQEHYLVTNPSLAAKGNSLLIEENLQALKDFSCYALLLSAGALTTTENEAIFLRMSEQIAGIEASRPKDEIAQQMVTKFLNWPYAELYAKHFVSPKGKEDIRAMARDICNAYCDILRRQTWMSDAARGKALQKLQAMQIHVGYPDAWEKYLAMAGPVTSPEDGGNLIGNVMALEAFGYRYRLSLLGTKPDRELWAAMPQEVNAYYSFNDNSIWIFAGILQPPFYDFAQGRAKNLGGIGFIIGHEISRAFDAIGSRYDENGHVADWWTAGDCEEYQRRCRSIVDCYDACRDADAGGRAVDGQKTLGETIADLSGMAAISEIIGDDPAALRECYEHLAHCWLYRIRPEAALQMVLLAAYPPGKVRVNAALSNTDAFYKAYDVQEGDRMYRPPESRAGIWR